MHDNNGFCLWLDTYEKWFVKSMIANQDKHMYDIIGLVESLRYEKILINQDQAIKEKV